MSNIINTINFLKGNPEKRYITLTKVDSNQPVGKPNIFIHDIPSEDLNAYIKNQLGPQTARVLLYAELRETKGSSSIKKSGFPIEIVPTAVPVTQNTEVQPMIQQALPAVPITQNQGLNGGFNGNGMLAVSITDYMASQKNETKVEMLLEKIEELKDKIGDLKKEIEDNKSDSKEKLKAKEKKIDTLTDELRGVRSELSVAEKQKEMAIMMAKLENKSFWDKVDLNAIMERAPELLGKMAEMKHGVVPDAGALSGTIGTGPKAEFIDYVNEHLTDAHANYLGSICHFMDNPDFINELTQLLNKYRQP